MPARGHLTGPYNRDEGATQGGGACRNVAARPWHRPSQGVPSVAAEIDPFETLRAPRAAIPWERPAQAPRDAVTERIWIGADPHGLGFEVAVASWSGASA